jgi:hypothetical protein
MDTGSARRGDLHWRVRTARCNRLLIPRLRKLRGVMLAIYAVCVYPANIYQAFAQVPFHGQILGWGFHAPRLALQPVLVWWPLFAAKVVDWPFRRSGTRARSSGAGLTAPPAG